MTEEFEKYKEDERKLKQNLVLQQKQEMQEMEEALKRQRQETIMAVTEDLESKHDRFTEITIKKSLDERQLAVDETIRRQEAVEKQHVEEAILATELTVTAEIEERMSSTFLKKIKKLKHEWEETTKEAVAEAVAEGVAEATRTTAERIGISTKKELEKIFAERVDEMEKKHQENVLQSVGEAASKMRATNKRKIETILMSHASEIQVMASQFRLKQSTILRTVEKNQSQLELARKQLRQTRGEVDQQLATIQQLTSEHAALVHENTVLVEQHALEQSATKRTAAVSTIQKYFRMKSAWKLSKVVNQMLREKISLHKKEADEHQTKKKESAMLLEVTEVQLKERENVISAMREEKEEMLRIFNEKNINDKTSENKMKREIIKLQEQQEEDMNKLKIKAKMVEEEYKKEKEKREIEHAAALAEVKNDLTLAKLHIDENSTKYTSTLTSHAASKSREIEELTNTHDRLQKEMKDKHQEEFETLQKERKQHEESYRHEMEKKLTKMKDEHEKQMKVKTADVISKVEAVHQEALKTACRAMKEKHHEVNLSMERENELKRQEHAEQFQLERREILKDFETEKIKLIDLHSVERSHQENEIVKLRADFVQAKIFVEESASNTTRQLREKDLEHQAERDRLKRSLSQLKIAHSDELESLRRQNSENIQLLKKKYWSESQDRLQEREEILQQSHRAAEIKKQTIEEERRIEREKYNTEILNTQKKNQNLQEIYENDVAKILRLKKVEIGALTEEHKKILVKLQSNLDQQQRAMTEMENEHDQFKKEAEEERRRLQKLNAETVKQLTARATLDLEVQTHEMMEVHASARKQWTETTSSLRKELKNVLQKHGEEMKGIQSQHREEIQRKKVGAKVREESLVMRVKEDINKEHETKNKKKEQNHIQELKQLERETERLHVMRTNEKKLLEEKIVMLEETNREEKTRMERRHGSAVEDMKENHEKKMIEMKSNMTLLNETIGRQKKEHEIKMSLLLSDEKKNMMKIVEEETSKIRWAETKKREEEIIRVREQMSKEYHSNIEIEKQRWTDMKSKLNAGGESFFFFFFFF